MKNTHGLITLIITISASICIAQSAQADSVDDASTSNGKQSSARSPEQIYIPPGVPRSTKPALSGNALDAHVLTQLKQHFDTADTNHAGRISVDQAQSAGWGYLVNHFTQIDRAGRGTVSFDEIVSYMRDKGARM